MQAGFTIVPFMCHQPMTPSLFIIRKSPSGRQGTEMLISGFQQSQAAGTGRLLSFCKQQFGCGVIFLAKFEQHLPFRLVFFRFCFELQTVWASYCDCYHGNSVFFEGESQRPLRIPATGINILVARQERAGLPGGPVTACGERVCFSHEATGDCAQMFHEARLLGLRVSKRIRLFRGAASV